MIAIGSRWRKKGALDPERFDGIGVDLEQIELEVVAMNPTSETESEPVVCPVEKGEPGLERWSVSEKSLTNSYEMVFSPEEMSEEDKLEIKGKLIGSWSDEIAGGLISNAL
jgi:hypothetical protein